MPPLLPQTTERKLCRWMDAGAVDTLQTSWRHPKDNSLNITQHGIVPKQYRRNRKRQKITGQILVLVYWKRQTLWSCLHGWIVDILGFKTSGKNICKTSVRWITCCAFTNCLGNRQKILYSLFSVSLSFKLILIKLCEILNVI